jgi:hypothetical protein
MLRYFKGEPNVHVVRYRRGDVAKTTGANIVSAIITRRTPLTIVSRMAENGAIFSDGVEADFLSFIAELTATIRIADKKATLLLPH